MLRDYQKDLISNIKNKMKEGKHRIVAVMPTGAGKTFTFVHITKQVLAKGGRVLIITDRVELMKQAGGALNVYGMDPILVEAGSRPYLGGSLYTAMVETLYRRIDQKDYQDWISRFNMIIIDECHMRAFDKLFPHFNDQAYILGFTATPVRIGLKGQMGEFYEDIVVGVEIKELIEKGWLSIPVYYGVPIDLKGIKKKAGDFDQNEVARRFSERKLFKGVAANLRQYGFFEKTLVFCSNIDSAYELQENLNEARFNADYVHSAMSMNDRKKRLEWFNKTDDAVLCNVGILTKGYDEPSIRNIVLYRATQSLPLYLQMVGRGSRIIKGEKCEFRVFDFGGNIERHGFWHEVHKWNLDIKKEREKQDAQVLKICKGCGNFIPVNATECEYCGYVYEKLKKEQEFALLQKLDPRDLRRKAQYMSLAKKVELSKRKIISPYWVLHKLKTFDEVRHFVSAMGYNPYWYEKNYHRFWWKDEYLKARSEGKIIINVRKIGI